MKLRSILIVALVLVFAVSALAEQKTEGQKRTVIIKDGKIIQDDIEGIPFELLRPGEFFGGKRAFLGVSAIDLTTELREHYGAEKSAGILVGAVEDGSPADKAGIRVGDIILSVDGTEVTTAMGLRKALREKKDGESVRVDVLRGRSRQTLVATVVEREAPNYLRIPNIEALGEPGEWRTRVSALPNCIELQAKIKELEAKMKDLEKRLQK